MLSICWMQLISTSPNTSKVAAWVINREKIFRTTVQTGALKSGAKVAKISEHIIRKPSPVSFLGSSCDRILNKTDWSNYVFGIGCVESLIEFWTQFLTTWFTRMLKSLFNVNSNESRSLEHGMVLTVCYVEIWSLLKFSGHWMFFSAKLLL